MTAELTELARQQAQIVELTERVRALEAAIANQQIDAVSPTRMLPAMPYLTRT